MTFEEWLDEYDPNATMMKNEVSGMRSAWNASRNATCDECAKVALGRLEGSSLRIFGAEIASEIEKLKVEADDEV